MNDQTHMVLPQKNMMDGVLTTSERHCTQRQ